MLTARGYGDCSPKYYSSLLYSFKGFIAREYKNFVNLDRSMFNEKLSRRVVAYWPVMYLFNQWAAGSLLIVNPSLSKNCLLLLTVGLMVVMFLTGSRMAERMHFGLEFRGGYEIYYVAEPLAGEKLTVDSMLSAVSILRQRADSIGMADPEIHLEGDNHIRIKIAGLNSAAEARAILGDATGLPILLTEKYTQTVGSVLGRTALEETLTAGAIGFALIILLLIALYRGLGLLASFCLSVYLWLLIVTFVAMHATLSLSAVVAFVLGIGMAADASVIAFERVREELKQHGDLSLAVRQGFSGSLPIIRDANLVTVIAMVVLFFAGIGPIQGFSLTMLMSIGISLATNFFLTRYLCQLLVDAKIISTQWLFASPAASTPESSAVFNFVKWGRTALISSLLVIVVGAWYFSQHGLNLDIDFTAGTALDIDLDTSIDQNTATKIISETGNIPDTLSVGGNNDQHIAVRFDALLKPEQLNRIISAFRSHYGAGVNYEENTADPGVARDFSLRAIYAICAASLAVAIFIGWRFSWPIALATLASIIQDLFLVCAIFALFKFEIDVTYVAAMLTVIGYSLNDKIVIFGRIRENLAIQSSQSVAAGVDRIALVNLVNRSIRQTLGRSIYTVLTVILASTSLLFFACEPLQMFSLAILLGVISGTYSSIFLASSCWVVLQTMPSLHQIKPLSYIGQLAFLSVTSLLITYFVIVGIQRETAVSDVSQSIFAGSTSSGAPLGDLSAYKTIAQDTLSLVQKGDFHAGRLRIKDLETEWDDAEETMKPMSPADWTSVDKSIDRALAQLRTKKPDGESAMAALKILLEKCTALDKKTEASLKQSVVQ